MKIKPLFLIFSSFIACFPAYAVDVCGDFNQGEIVVAKAKSSVKKAVLNNEEIPVTKDNFFFMAFGRNETNRQKLQITSDEDFLSNYDFEIKPTKWDIQNIKGVPPRKVTPSDSDTAAIDLERKVVRTALQTSNNNSWWKTGFIMPVEGRISGQFGGQRIMNNIPKNPHQGMDIAAKEGLPVKASADGEVVTAYPDLFYSGNVIVIDHGSGLQTIYAHLKDMNVKRGDKVKQGDIIGTVGKTGRATGPHLHWGASWQNIRFNPQSLLKVSENLQKCSQM